MHAYVHTEHLYILCMCTHLLMPVTCLGVNAPSCGKLPSQCCCACGSLLSLLGLGLLCVCVCGWGGSICSTSWHALLRFFKAKEKVKRPKSKGASGVPGVAPLVGVTWTSVGMHGIDGGCRDE